MTTSFDTVSLFDSPGHRYTLLGWEEHENEGVVQTNQYLVVHGEEVALLDPGGAHVFPRVLANVAELTNINSVKHIFYSHQDPDVSSGITLWLAIAEQTRVYISGLWTRFLPHFGVYDQRRITAIPDHGGVIAFSDGYKMEALPAHFLHSTGQFSLYDPASKLLFTGDIGAAIFPKGQRYPKVTDFNAHLRLMEGFHQRYMGSNLACRKWVETVSSRDIRAIAPQHGAIIEGENVGKFFDWLSRLKCGIDLLDSFYGVRSGSPSSLLARK